MKLREFFTLSESKPASGFCCPWVDLLELHWARLRKSERCIRSFSGALRCSCFFSTSSCTLGSSLPTWRYRCPSYPTIRAVMRHVSTSGRDASMTRLISRHVTPLTTCPCSLYHALRRPVTHTQPVGTNADFVFNSEVVRQDRGNVIFCTPILADWDWGVKHFF